MNVSHAQILNNPILHKIPNSQTVLDVGCGRGQFGFLIKSRKNIKTLVGLDIWKPHLSKLSQFQVYDHLIQTRIPPMPLKNKSVDVSLACEILEHLTRDEGIKLLEDLERITNNLIIVSTPQNYPQDIVYGNIYERHLTEWACQEFEKYGFDTTIISTLPKTLKIFDITRRFLLRLPKAPRFIIAQKTLN